MTDQRQKARDLLRLSGLMYKTHDQFGGARAKHAAHCAKDAADHARAANDPLLAEFAEKCADVAEGAG